MALILEGARRLFAANGFDATSMDDIAEAASVAKGAVYHHFASKEAVFLRVLEDVQAGRRPRDHRPGPFVRSQTDAARHGP